ncbi:hypothetical protein LAZ67_11000958 [Cordylochernes scorpioides]|uniref:Uncharacterized protein n=1 Tax=Cordylochernes scorpioides TaxID=51811 RepID=A0ABY6KYU1_9ARAC|nr:hypothetical protein LAZ67_11000958 [Cordylochernes scorpioides]
MVFRNGEKVARSERWYWGQSPLSVTSKYTYLGYPLTPSIYLTQVALNYRGRTMAAMGAVGEIILKSKLKSFHASMRLLDSMILTVLLYAAPIWAHDQALILDRIQDTFLRRFLCLPSYTPGYILRAETGRNSLDITVKKLTLKFWTRILKMDGSRLPSICLAHLWDISISSKQNIGLIRNGARESAPSTKLSLDLKEKSRGCQFVWDSKKCRNGDTSLGDKEYCGRPSVVDDSHLKSIIDAYTNKTT